MLVLHVRGLRGTRTGRVIAREVAEIQLSGHIRGRRHGAVAEVHGGRRLAGSKALEPSTGTVVGENGACVALTFWAEGRVTLPGR